MNSEKVCSSTNLLVVVSHFLPGAPAHPPAHVVSEWSVSVYRQYRQVWVRSGCESRERPDAWMSDDGVCVCAVARVRTVSVCGAGDHGPLEWLSRGPVTAQHAWEQHRTRVR